MKDKNIFDVLENAENDSMERLIDKCPEISDEQLERIFKMSEKKFRKQRAEKERTERDNTIKMTENDVVEGVERSKRPAWLTPLTTAASVLLIAGIAIGSTAMLKRNTKPKGVDGGVTPAITVSTTTGTGTNIVSTDKNGSTVTGTGVTTTTTVTAATSADGSSEKEADTEFIKPFVGRWRYEMSSVNNLDIPESADYMGTVTINDDATYTKVDVSGNVTHGTISDAVEEIGGTKIQCLDFSVNEYSSNSFLTNRAYFVESRPYELHFGNSYIARLVREDHVEQIETSWKSAYRSELLSQINQGGVVYDPMYDIHDIDGDGIPELIISKDDASGAYIYYYENGRAVSVSDSGGLAIANFGRNGTFMYCQEENLIGFTELFGSGYGSFTGKFVNHKVQEIQHIFRYTDYSEEMPIAYEIDNELVSEEEYKKAETVFDSRNWEYVGRKYNFGDFSPLLDK